MVLVVKRWTQIRQFSFFTAGVLNKDKVQISSRKGFGKGVSERVALEADFFSLVKDTSSKQGQLANSFECSDCCQKQLSIINKLLCTILSMKSNLCRNNFHFSPNLFLKI